MSAFLRLFTPCVFFLTWTSVTLTIGQKADPAAFYASLDKVRVAESKRYTDAGKPVDSQAVNAVVRREVEKFLSGVVAANVDPGQGLDWARLYGMTGNLHEANVCLYRFLASGPNEQRTFDAKLALLANWCRLKDVGRVETAIYTLEAPEKKRWTELGAIVASQAAPLLADERGLAAAEKALSYVETLIPSENDFKDVSDKAPIVMTKASVAAAYTQIYLDNGMDDKAIAVNERFMEQLGKESPIYGVVAAAKLHIQMRGKPTPALTAMIETKFFGDLSKNLGKVTLIDFGYYSTPAGGQRLPIYKDLYKTYHGKGLELVFASGMQSNQDENQALKDLQAYVAQNQIPWPAILVGPQAFQSYGVRLVPHAVVVDRKGVVRYVLAGFSERGVAGLKKAIFQALQERP